jgi:hypothetical protein
MMSEPTESDINRVVHGYDLADAAADYGQTIVCQTENISGDNYRMVWSTEYSGGFEPNK